MTHPQQIADATAKSVEQSNYRQDSTITSLAITTVEDNKLFIKDKSSTGSKHTIDLSAIDIYKPQHSDDDTYGPDRRSLSFKNQDHNEVKASTELRFDNFDLHQRRTDIQNLSSNKKPLENEPGGNFARQEIARGENKDKSDEQQKQEAREKLTKEAEEKFKNDPAKLEAFKENMRLFEQRAKKDKLSPAEIAKTYTEINRLLEAKGDKPLKPEQRKTIAEQIMRQAADPTTIDQGRHNTCNMATVESRMYTRNPSAAARLVTDVSLTGEYVATDGRRVRLNPGAHDEARNPKTNDGERSHASEIFQVTAVNLHIDQINRRTNPRGQLRYEQHPVKPGSADTGERIIDYGVKPPVFIDYHPGVFASNLGSLSDVYAAITGKNEKGIVLAQDRPALDPSEGVIRITSERQLNEELAKAKKEGKLPLIVAVNTKMEPFWSDSGAGSAGGSGGGHVVTITDYTPGPPAKVTIDNQWGKKADHDATKPITVHTLFQAMQDRTLAINELKRQTGQ